MSDIKKECETKNSFQKLEDIDLQIGHAPGYDEGMEGEAIRNQTEYGKSNSKPGVNKRKHMGPAPNVISRRSD